MQDDLFGMAAPGYTSEPGRPRRKGAPVPLSLKVTHRGSVSLCGFGRFPVTLTKGQWMRLLAMSDEIRAFIATREGFLAPDD
jgi:hypothetical protein